MLPVSRQAINMEMVWIREIAGPAAAAGRWRRASPDRPAPRWMARARPASDPVSAIVRCRDDRSDPLSRRLPVGRRHVGLPDRGLAARRRRRPEQLASLRAHPRAHAQRRHWRRGVRPLPPLRRRRGADGGTRSGRLPLQHLVEPHPARRPRARESPRTRLLLAPGRPPARPRDPPAGHAVPLGSAGSARGPGRLARATGCRCGPRSTSRGS